MYQPHHHHFVHNSGHTIWNLEFIYATVRTYPDPAITSYIHFCSPGCQIYHRGTLSYLWVEQPVHLKCSTGNEGTFFTWTYYPTATQPARVDLATFITTTRTSPQCKHRTQEACNPFVRQQPAIEANVTGSDPSMKDHGISLCQTEPHFLFKTLSYIVIFILGWDLKITVSYIFHYGVE